MTDRLLQACGKGGPPSILPPLWTLRSSCDVSLQGCNMKLVLGFVVVWLLCGVVAASLIQDTRSASLTDVQWGPFSLIEAFRA